MREVIADLQRKVEENFDLQKKVEELEEWKRGERRDKKLMPPPHSAPPPLELEIEQELPQTEVLMNEAGEKPLPRHLSRRSFLEKGEIVPEVRIPYLKAAGSSTLLVKEGEFKNDASSRLYRKTPQLEDEYIEEDLDIAQTKTGGGIYNGNDSVFAYIVDRLEEMERSMKEMRNEMKGLKQEKTQPSSRAQSGNRARENAPKATSPRGVAKGHPVPVA